MKKLKSLIAMLLIFTLAITMNTTTAFAKSRASMKVSANKTTLYLLDSANCKTQLKVTYGGRNVTKSAKYSTSNKKIATISKRGVVTAKRAGTVKMKVKYKKLSRTITIRVKKAKLSLNKKNITLITGQNTTLKAFANKSGVSNKNIKWSTSNKTIATVNKNGIVSAKKTGTAKITCTTSIGKVTCTVNVKAEEKKQDVPSGNNNSDANHHECTEHQWMTTKEPVTKWQIECMGCHQWFDSNDELAYHALTSPVNSGCGATAFHIREVVITPGTQTCSVCGKTRQLYNIGDVIQRQ
nr:MAG TPA: Tail tube protein [Caudoviricetes sp.]